MSEVVYEAVTNITNDIDKILIFVSDSAAYMLKAGRLLKEKFSNMLHMICLAHALHRIYEFIRHSFTDVDTFVNNLKKNLLKVPNRISAYKEQCPNLPLPPEPVITRWGTWLETYSFYAANFPAIRNFLATLDPNEAQSIVHLQKYCFKC